MESFESFIKAAPVVNKTTKQKIGSIDLRCVSTFKVPDNFTFVFLVDCHGTNCFPGQYFAYMGEEYRIEDLYYTLDGLYISCLNKEKYCLIPLVDLYGKCSLVDPPIEQAIPLTPAQAKKLKNELEKNKQTNTQLP